jgi:hypothetical protein
MFKGKIEKIEQTAISGQVIYIHIFRCVFKNLQRHRGSIPPPGTNQKISALNKLVRERWGACKWVRWAA